MSLISSDQYQSVLQQKFRYWCDVRMQQLANIINRIFIKYIQNVKILMKIQKIQTSQTQKTLSFELRHRRTMLI